MKGIYNFSNSSENVDDFLGRTKCTNLKALLEKWSMFWHRVYVILLIATDSCSTSGCLGELQGLDHNFISFLLIWLSLVIKILSEFIYLTCFENKKINVSCQKS